MASGEEIYRWFTQGKIEPLEFAALEIKALSDEFRSDVTGLENANRRMLTHWEGDGADAAAKGIGPLVDGHNQSLPMVIEAGRSVDDQGSQLANAKHSVVEVPPEPEEPSPFARMASAILPGAPDAEASYRDGMNRHNEASASNVRVMDQYDSATGGTERALPNDYGIVADDGAAIQIGSTSASSVGGPSGTVPTFGGAGSLSGGGGSGGAGGFGGGPSFGGGGSGSLPPGGGNPSFATPSPAPGGSPPGGGTPMRPGPGIIAPVTPGPVGGGDAERRAGRTASGRPAAGSSRAGARLAGAPRSGVAVPKGTPTVLRGGPGAAARLSGGTAGLQAGKGAGVGMPGGGAGGGTAARAAGGLGGRAGTGGMAPGAGGSRGQGAEDAEHKDKYAIKEELDDGLSVVYDELGAKTVDERTGRTVVSPVIGEPEHRPDPDPRPGT